MQQRSLLIEAGYVTDAYLLDPALHKKSSPLNSPSQKYYASYLATLNLSLSAY